MATPRLPFDSVEDRFQKKSYDLFNSMNQRFKEKRDKRGRVIRVGRQVPFTLPVFRAWLVEKLGGENGVIKCRYCAQFVTIDDMVLDHDVPVSQGGGLGFDNLDLLCKKDNDAKGGMTGEAYQKLLDWSAEKLKPADRDDILHRLSIAVQLAAQRRWDIIKKAKEEKKRQQVAVADEQF